MGVSLSKGGNVSLSKEAPGLTAVLVGLGWDVRTTTGTDYDLDASRAAARRPPARSRSDQHFVFYNNLKSPDGSVEHTGDNLTGEGEGDDEVRQGEPRRRTRRGRPRSSSRSPSTTPRTAARASARSGTPSSASSTRPAAPRLARYDLSEDAATETAMVFGELYRHGAEWKFRAVGQGYASGLSGIASDFGVGV